MDNNSSVFGGLSTTTNSAPLSDSERKKQIEDQQEDTLRRKVLWSADEIANKQEDLVDAQGEIDPDFSGEVEDMEQGPPIGIRAPNGEIINLSQAEVDESMHVDVPANTKAVVCGGFVFLCVIGSLWRIASGTER
jgi:CHASE3 domain sensor protein